MLETLSRHYDHSIAWTPKALERIWREIVAIPHAAPAEGDQQPTCRLIVQLDGRNSIEVTIDDLRALRNPREGRITGVWMTVSGQGSSDQLLVSSAESERSAVTCSIVDYVSDRHGRFVEILDEEVRNCRTFYSRPREVIARIADWPWMRLVTILALLWAIFSGVKGCVETASRDHYFARERRIESVLKLKPDDYPPEQAKDIEAVQKELRESTVKRTAWEHGIPILTILYIANNVVGACVMIATIVLIRRWFPMLQFRIGEGEERYVEKRRFQVTVCTLLLTTLVFPLLRGMGLVP